MGKCLGVTELETTPFIHLYGRCMRQIFDVTIPFVYDLKKYILSIPLKYIFILYGQGMEGATVVGNCFRLLFLILLTTHHDI